MKILGWNCRGISNASTVRALGAQIKRARPDVVFLSETKTNEKCMEFVKSSVKFDNKFIVEAKGSAGGLCILWKNSMSLNVVDFDKNLIAVKIADQCYEWLLVGFYGPSYHSKKSKAWGNLFALLESHQGPWAWIGDFNFIINDDEQIGGNKRGSSATNYLKELLFKFNVVDLGYSGNKFTWARGKWGKASIKRRLDKRVASISWQLAFPKAIISHLGAINSDHAPILLDTNPQDSFAHRPFRFEAAWLRDERCTEVIGKVWDIEETGSDFIKLYKKQASTEKLFANGTRRYLVNARTELIPYSGK